MSTTQLWLPTHPPRALATLPPTHPFAETVGTDDDCFPIAATVSTTQLQLPTLTPTRPNFLPVTTLPTFPAPLHPRPNLTQPYRPYPNMTRYPYRYPTASCLYRPSTTGPTVHPFCPTLLPLPPQPRPLCLPAVRTRNIANNTCYRWRDSTAVSVTTYSTTNSNTAAIGTTTTVTTTNSNTAATGTPFAVPVRYFDSLDCFICQATFGSTFKMCNHLEQTHRIRIPQPICPVCNKRFRRWVSLRRHTWLSHKTY